MIDWLHIIDHIENSECTECLASKNMPVASQTILYCMSLRVVFMGTPQFAVPTLTEIVGQGHEVAACYTREPARIAAHLLEYGDREWVAHVCENMGGAGGRMASAGGSAAASRTAPSAPTSAEATLTNPASRNDWALGRKCRKGKW